MQNNRKDVEAAIRGLSEIVIGLHKGGMAVPEIASSIESLGFSPDDAKMWVKKIVGAYKKGIDLSRKPTFFQSYPFFRESVYFIGGAAIVSITAIVLSLILGIIHNFIGPGAGAAKLIGIGEKLAGMFVGGLGTALSKSAGSTGMFVGCWVGVGVYYWWLFSSLF